MAACWTIRGCDDEEMIERCPHSDSDAEQCPAECILGMCTRPTHQVTSDPALVFDPTIDRGAAVKEQCTFCAFFLTHGPRVAS